MSILMAYSTNNTGRFVYLSSQEVYTGFYEENIDEEEALTPVGKRAMVLAQGEDSSLNDIVSSMIPTVDCRCQQEDFISLYVVEFSAIALVT